MVNNDIIIEMLTSIWAFSPQSEIAHIKLAEDILLGKDVIARSKTIIESQNKEPIVFASVDAKNITIRNSASFESAKKGDIAILPFSGTMMKNDGFCSMGTQSYGELIAQAGRNRNVRGVLLDVDSGGGQVKGTQTLGNIIKGFEAKYNKPIHTFVNGVAASAMYWAASASSNITLAENNSAVGSIGVMATFFNQKELMSNIGVKEVVVRAKKSFNKNEAVLQAMDGNFDKLQSEVLDPMNEQFHKSVRSNRKGKINLQDKVESADGSEVAEVLTGRMYIGNDAIKAGLADNIGSLEYAVRKLKTASNKLSNESTVTMNNYSKYSDDALVEAIQSLQTSKPSAEDENYDAHMTELAFAQSVQNERSLKAQVEDSNESEELANANAEVERLTTANAEQATLIAEQSTTIDNQNTLITEANQTGTEAVATIAEHLATIEASNTTIGELNASNESATKKITAMEDFINSEYGEDSASKFVADNDGNIAQPQLETKKVYLNKSERTAMTNKTAKELAEQIVGTKSN